MEILRKENLIEKISTTKKQINSRTRKNSKFLIENENEKIVEDLKEKLQLLLTLKYMQELIVENNSKIQDLEYNVRDLTNSNRHPYDW